MGMKLVIAVLLLSGVAYAQPAPVDPFAAPVAQRPRGELRMLLLKHFDADRDGRLDPRERMKAARVLQRISNKLMMSAAKMQRGMRGEPRQMRNDMRPRMMQRERFFRRYDANRDGNVGPGEIPPAVADELRPLDQDGDGWLSGDELP
jgi:hypothetical protein